MKIAIIGGHLSPALSVIDVLPKNTKLLFIGRRYTFEGDKTLSLEYKTITGLGIQFLPIITARFQRKFTRYTIPSLFKLPTGFIQAFSILNKFKPDVVLGFGGYLEIPVVLASFFLRIPVVIHEQTQEAGLANKISSRFAKKICVSWKSSEKHFPKEKTTFTGNPIRKFKILASRRSGQNSKLKIQEDNLPLIYITGGSAGSHFINNLVEGCLEKLLRNFRIIHQTGETEEFKDFTKLIALRKKLSPKLTERYVIQEFIEPFDVFRLLKRATLVIGRSGINTVCELMYIGTPCLLIPLPFSQNNEQFKNAVLLKKIGICEIADQTYLDSEKFYRIIKSMINNIENYKKNAHKAKSFVHKDAGLKIVKVLEYAAKNK